MYGAGEMAGPSRVFLSLGSNLGDRAGNLRAALQALAGTPGVAVARVSGVYETAPMGDTEQPAFLNLAAEIETELAPLELLNVTQAIEHEIGRRATHRWGPRVIDIDLVLWGDRVVAEPRLQVPHPEFRRRAFVLIPLCELAPDAVDPVTGRSMAALARAEGVWGTATRYNDTP